MGKKIAFLLLTLSNAYATIDIRAEEFVTHTGTLSHIEAGGIGYNEGYTTTGLLFAHPINKVDYFLVDAKLHVFNSGKIATNIGLGGRFYPKEMSTLFGLNFYFDSRDYHSNEFFQLGWGVEWLGPVDLRLNGYIPVGQKNSVVKTKKFASYSEGYYIASQTSSYALKGIDFSVGGFVCKTKHITAYSTLGPYYLADAGVAGSFGGKGMLTVKVSPYISISGYISYDKIFQTRVQGQLSVIIPLSHLSKPKNLFYPPRVIRSEIIPLVKHSEWIWNY